MASARYTKADMRADLLEAIKTRQPIYSNRPLGNSANAALWTTDKIDQLWEGLFSAWKKFFREFDLRTYSRLVLAQCMQESTGDYRLGSRAVDFTFHGSCGFSQITPGSVMFDFHRFGRPIRSELKGRTKVVLADPARTLEMDTTDPGLCVLLMAWYVKNCVAIGVSLNEHAHRIAWHIPPAGDRVSNTYGTALVTWLAGPHNDYLTGNGARAFKDYGDRICDYFVQSGFGSSDDFFQRLMPTRLERRLVLVTRAVVDGSAGR